MTALATPTLDSHTAESEANRWLADHHLDLVRLSRVVFGHLNREDRDEAVAETVAYTAKAAHAAAHRGTLHRITPSTCVHYARLHHQQGRRAAGTSTRCVMSEACRQKHGVRLVSLDHTPPHPSDRNADDIDYHEALPDPRADQPIDAARRRLDFPVLLDRGGVSDKARATLRYLAETYGTGKQSDLAAELMVSPARITQLKRELADALATDGYHGPLGRRAATY